MISIICVFNNHEKLSECLLSSLNYQTSSYDLVLVDNTGNEFENAAIALNKGATQAKGEFLMFVHQDVIFYSPFWIEKIENFLVDLKTFGWVGVAGVTESGQLHGFLKDSNSLLWTQFGELVEVQTLDELILICKKREDGKYFDEKIPGWHSYGADACVSSKLNGRKNYVVSFPVWHNSNRSNAHGLKLSHEYLKNKFRGNIDLIYTTSGLINTGSGVALASQKLKRLVDKFLRLLSIKSQRQGFWDFMNKITSNCKTINCYYGYFPHASITAESFTQFPTNNKKIIKHHFTEEYLEKTDSDAVVFEANIAEKIADRQFLLDSLLISKKVIFCTNETNHEIVLRELNNHYKTKTHKTVLSATGGFGKTIYVSQIIRKNP